MRQEFAYNRSRLVGSLFLGLAAAFVVFLLLFGVMMIALLPSLCVLGLFLLFVIVSLGSPLWTAHVLTGDVLHIRYGLVLWTKVKAGDIASVEETGSRPLMEGVTFSVRGRVLYVTTEPRNLVAIRLREKRRFPAALWKSADTIVLSLSEPRRFVTELEKLLS